MPKVMMFYRLNHDGVEYYSSEDGMILKRETGVDPHGNELKNMWVLRGIHGEFLDFDTFRSNIADRHNLELE